MLPANTQKRKRICRCRVVTATALSVGRFFFSAVTGLLEFFVLRPDAGALQPVNNDVAIFLNELQELLGSPWRPFRQHSEVRKAPQQDRQEVLHMVVGMP